MLHIAVSNLVAGENLDLVQSHRAFPAPLLKAARVGLSSGVTPPARTQGPLAAAARGMCCRQRDLKPRRAPTFQRTLETSSFHFRHLNSHQMVGLVYWDLHVWACGWCLCFGGAGLEVLGCASTRETGCAASCTHVMQDKIAWVGRGYRCERSG